MRLVITINDFDFINTSFIILLCKLFSIIFAILMYRLYLRNENTMISVIIPTYNRANLIRRSINSILKQTYQNLEVIVVDDGSTDNTPLEIKRIQDNRIKYIKLIENKGGSNARNIGIKKARGKYISFQDSDDLYYPNKLEKQIQNIIIKKSNLDFCKIKVIYNSSLSLFYPNKRQEKSILKGKIFDELVSKGNFISTQAILVQKNFMRKFFFDTNMPRLQDYEVILRMIPKVKISYTPNVLVDLQMQKDSVTQSKVKLKKAISILLTKKFNFNLNQKILFLNYLNKIQSLLHQSKKYNK